MAAPNDADLLALATSLARRLIAAGRTVVTAESCTGGWVAKVCTDLPGSSRWYLGGIVSYADTAKTDVLGVPASLLQLHGAVSEPVVRSMAQGALHRLGGDSSVAVSGIAGPGGGCDVTAACEVLPGYRESVRRAAVQRALVGLLER